MENTGTDEKRVIQVSPETKGIVLPILLADRGLEYLIELVKQIRPNSPQKTEQAEQRFKSLLYQLQQDASSLISLRAAIRSQFVKSEVLPALIESGLISSRGFVQELGRKLKHKILPELQEKSDFLFVISRVFYKNTDYIWVGNIDRELWKKLFRLLRVHINMNDQQLIDQLRSSLRILSFRVATLGLEKEVAKRFGANKDAIVPFLEQNRLITRFLGEGEITDDDARLLLSNFQEQLHNCRQSIIWLRDQRVYHGTSLSQTFLTTRILQMIDRMLIISDVFDRDNQLDEDRFIDYFLTVVTNENKKNSIREFLSDNLGLLAYQIAEHKGKKGEKYITTNSKEFNQLFQSAVSGGFIVSFVAVLKNLMGKLPWTPFWLGFAYSVNYSAGFVLMDRTNSTLATKQPAYTASAVANSLDSKKHKGKPELKNLAITIGNISRSQIASFAGNLLVVFPFTYLLAWMMDRFFQYRIVDGEGALKLLESQHPFHSLSLLYACFTGVFLFLSGIISGYVENHIVYGQLNERLRNHPVLSHSMSPRKLNRLVDSLNTYSGALTGSIALGFFLGMSAAVGKIFGIPFDIRHITISAGNTAIGYFGLEQPLPLSYLLTVFFGVLGIGFLNFFVSFSLAYFVALKSRGIQLREYPELIGYIWRYFRRFPGDFILPPLRVRNADDI
ncbi:site-specific recombinase [Flavihumibacter profundi]|uniref:site-specific recombinase n=1 Tax=Flavihumibacter profundi TaxID=2716883 RepID=UPI001CC60F10|nr:site-specific recombinase [Flavihumibacter profundi]MBZ5856349.1 site-specific recombinase [Flavihumibacter profundi]